MSDVYRSRASMPDAPQPNISGVAAPTYDTTTLSRAISGLGDAGAALQLRMREAQDQTQVATATTEYVTRLDALRDKYEKDPEFQTAPQRFGEELSQLEQDAIGRIDNPDLHARALLEWRRAGLTAGRSVKQSAFGKQVDVHNAAYFTQTEMDVRAAAHAVSPIERQSVFERQSGALLAGERAGIWTKTAALQRFQKFTDAVGVATSDRVNDDLNKIRTAVGSAADTAGVMEATAAARRQGELLIEAAPFTAEQKSAALRAWRAQASETGFARLAVVDPAAASNVGGIKIIDRSLVDGIISAESSSNPAARNAQSSATGAGQFIDATWLSLISRHRPELAVGKSRDDVLALRSDPVLSRDMVERNAEENAAFLRGRGLSVTRGNLYLSHFLGPDRAAAVLAVDPDTPVEKLLSSQQIDKNARVLAGRTAGEVTAWAARRVGGDGAALGAVGDPLFGDIPYERRVAIIGAGLQTAARDRAAAEQQANAANKLQADAALKEAYARADRHELTGDYVESIRQFISPPEYKNLLTALGPDAASDDTEAMVDMTRRVDSDDPIEFQKAATVYLREGKLKTSTFLALSEKNRTARRDDQPSSPYRSGRDMVKTALDPGLLVSGPARAPFAAAQANALIEFDNFMQANPGLSRGDVIAAARDVVRRYQTLDFDTMKPAQGLSPYFGSKAMGEVKLDDVARAEQLLRRDLEAGAITEIGADMELNRLKIWREILSREQAAKEAPRGRAGRQ